MKGKLRFWAPLRGARSPLALVAWALLLPSATLAAQADLASLFTKDARAPVAGPVGRPAAGAATGEPAGIGRSRIARVDLGRLSELREAVVSGRPGKLRLNLLHGVEHLATVERSAPTASGYTLSGPLDNVPFGRAVLVVNGGTVMGRVYTPQGAWSIRTAGAVQVVEPMEGEPWRCGDLRLPRQPGLSGYQDGHGYGRQTQNGQGHRHHREARRKRRGVQQRGRGLRLGGAARRRTALRLERRGRGGGALDGRGRGPRQRLVPDDSDHGRWPWRDAGCLQGRRRGAGAAGGGAVNS